MKKYGVIVCTAMKAFRAMIVAKIAVAALILTKTWFAMYAMVMGDGLFASRVILNKLNGEGVEQGAQRLVR